MSYYKYVKTFPYTIINNRGGYTVRVTYDRVKDTLHHHTTALEELLKNELIICNWCEGIGQGPHMYPRERWKNLIIDCIKCNATGVICAWCRCDETRCSCGGE